MHMQSSRSISRYAYISASIIIAAVILSASLVVAPAMETRKTSTVTSMVTTTSPQVTVTSTLNFTITLRSTTTTTDTEMSLLPCDHSVSESTGTPVLLMHPNSTGYVCVTYGVGTNTYIPKPVLLIPFSIGTFSCSTVNGVRSCVPVESHSFQSSVIPRNETLSGTFSFFTVVYIVKALSNATGFYDFSAPWSGACGFGMPMAVGYSASQVNASNFTRSISCGAVPAPLFGVVLEYVSGIDVTYINGFGQ